MNISKWHIDTRHLDWVFWTLLAALAVISLMMSMTAAAQKVYQAGSILPVLKHIFFLFAGLGCAATIQYVPSRWLRPCGYVLLFVTDIFLYLMLIPGFPLAATINGATRWIRLFGMTLQPSEFAKLAVVVVVADLLSRAKSDEERKRVFWITLIITGLTVLPILTQNLSTAVLICVIVAMLWIMAAMPWRYVVSTIVTALTAFMLFLAVIDVAFVLPGRTYTGPMSRATTWCNRINRAVGLQTEAEQAASKSFDKNRQEILCHVAVARGGVSPFGVGPGKSLENRFLPLADADCVFAIFVEECGIVGAVIVIFIYLMILFRACLRSWRFSHYSAALMVMGLALMLVVQALISMMVVVGIGPVTGQPLPLISTGGTTLLVTGMTFGVLMSVSREQSLREETIRLSASESRSNVPEIELNSSATN